MSISGEFHEIQQALRPEKVGWKGSPRVEEYRFELGKDQSDDDAVFVTVVLSENTSDAEWTSEALDPLITRVREVVAETHSDRYVYVRFNRPSDFKLAG